MVSMNDDDKEETEDGDEVKDNTASGNGKEQLEEKVFCVEYSNEKSLLLEPCHGENPNQKWQWTHL